VRLCVAAVTMVITLAVWGCGKPVLRVADASLGDYYTEKEYKKLQEEQRLEYCEELAEQDSLYREEIADARSAAGRYVRRASAARAAADSLGRLADSLESKVAQVRDLENSLNKSAGRGTKAKGSITREGEVFASGPGSVVVRVRPGDSLWSLAAREAIYGDGRHWPKLYEANRDRIRDADRIFPGQELTVPR
jgi:nucleoid-associated protein YgaU